MTATAPELELTARALVAPGKDPGRGRERWHDQEALRSIDVESTEDNRRAYRELLFTTEGVEDYISGVILYDETIRQRASDGTPFRSCSRRRGSFPGSRSTSARTARTGRETITGGLDGLRGRLEEYRALGARFAKWRATYSIGDHLPSEYCVWTNAHALARYAALCQEAGIVPIVEPEVLQDGTHTIDESAKATGRVLQGVYTELRDQRVDFRGTLLKPNMVMSGYEASAAQAPTRSPSGPRCLLSPRPGCGPRDRVPLGRPVGRGRPRTSTR